MVTSLYLRRSCGVLLMVLCLCICVIAQMLGVPTTLLSPAGSADLLGSSVLEGFSVLPQVPEALVAVTFVAVWSFLSAMHVPVMASAVFHPPVR